jgi:hypothetical protein
MKDCMQRHEGSERDDSELPNEYTSTRRFD